MMLCSFVLQAQHYHQLTGENKLWSVYVKPQSIVGTPPWETHYYRFNRDTTINNISYYRFQFSRDSLNNWYTSKYIREDSTKKVFQWDYLRGEQLLYNFNANVNDTFVNIDSRISVVSAVDSVFILSSYRKRIHLDYTRIQGSDTIVSTHNYWVEGIGSIYDPLDILKPVWGEVLLCYYEKDTLK
jgi:hypothetical protein